MAEVGLARFGQLTLEVSRAVLPAQRTKFSDEAEFLAAEAEIKRFAPRQRIFQADDSRPFSATRSNGVARGVSSAITPDFRRL